MSRLLRLSDDQWRRIEPLLAPQRKTGGRPAKPHRPIVEAMIWVLRTGAPWRDSRGSTMECRALFDALHVMELLDEQTHQEGKELLVRVVSTLSKMC